VEIKNALSAAPDFVTDKATVMDWPQPGEQHGAILLTGSNDWTRTTKPAFAKGQYGERRMIYELRVLHCVPGRLPALLKRFETNTLPLFEKHGIKQLGFWTVEIGDSNNDLFLILQWESLAERERKFGAFLEDPEWLEARRKSEEDGPIDASITNAILVPTAFSMVR
jgi:hypothetical protein